MLPSRGLSLSISGMGVIIPAFFLGVAARLERMESWDFLCPSQGKQQSRETREMSRVALGNAPRKGSRPWPTKAGGPQPQTDERLSDRYVRSQASCSRVYNLHCWGAPFPSNHGRLPAGGSSGANGIIPGQQGRWWRTGGGTSKRKTRGLPRQL